MSATQRHLQRAGIWATYPMMLAFCATVNSSPYPDAGSVYREFKDHSFVKPIKAAEPELKKQVDADQDGSTISVQVNHFQVVGNTRLDTETLHTVLSPYTDRQLDQRQLNEARQALKQSYREAGYFLAEVYLPPQTIVDGVVTLHVYEGLLEPGGVHLSHSSDRVKADKVEAILATNLTTNKVLESDELERSLLLIDDLPGVSAAGTVFPGSSPGTAGLLIQTYSTPLVSGNIDVDNFGSYYTGEERVGATIYVNSPARRADQLTLRLVSAGQHSNYAFVSYDMPFGGNGLRIGASIDYLDYELQKQFKDLGSEGDITELRLFANYPIIRTRHFNLLSRIDLSHLELDDNDDRGLEALRDVDSLIFTLHGDHDDDFIASGITYYSLQLTAGSLDIKGNRAFEDFDQQNANTEGSFGKLNFSLARLQHLVGDLSTYLSLSGQVASENLDTSQKFFIGGPFSVAGYPTGEVSGDEGLLVSADLRYDFYAVPWQGNLQLSAFYSWGEAKLFHETWDGWQGPRPDLPNRIELQSAGLGLNQTWGDQFVLRAMIGWQIGDNDGEDPVTGEGQ